MSQIGLGSVLCPLCQKLVHLKYFDDHLRERHNIKKRRR